MAEAPLGMWPPRCSLIVLTGGASRRLGRDKATTHLGGARLVDRLLSTVPAEVPVVIVGSHLDELADRAVFVREEPPGSGPLAAIGAGLSVVTTPLVGVLAADMPFAAPVVAGALQRLAAAEAPDADNRVPQGASAGRGRTGDAVVPLDDQGRRQPLSAAFRTQAVRGALATLEPLADKPVKALLPLLDVMEWPMSTAALVDVDTKEQLASARGRVAQEGWEMQDWVDAVREALGVEVPLDIDVVLDAARDAAHAVDRPAAPVTTYLLGAAVARGADPAEAASQISELALGWGKPKA